MCETRESLAQNSQLLLGRLSNHFQRKNDYVRLEKKGDRTLVETTWMEAEDRERQLYFTHNFGQVAKIEL